MPEPISIEPKDPTILYTKTLSIPVKPTPKQVIELMAEVAKLLSKMSVQILRDDNGPAMCSPANPAPNAMLQSAATLETGAIQFDALVKQQAGLIGPQGPQRPEFRRN